MERIFRGSILEDTMKYILAYAKALEFNSLDTTVLATSSSVDLPIIDYVVFISM